MRIIFKQKKIDMNKVMKILYWIITFESTKRKLKSQVAKDNSIYMYKVKKKQLISRNLIIIKTIPLIKGKILDQLIIYLILIHFKLSRTEIKFNHQNNYLKTNQRTLKELVKEKHKKMIKK